MTDHPYLNQPDAAFWRRLVDPERPGNLNLAVDSKGLSISPRDRIMTAGSCFAQHISRHLDASGYRYLVTEKSHVAVRKTATESGYGVYSARYGNVYTPRQLLQLLRRSLGSFTSTEHAWQTADGAWVDPFRPQIEPGGYMSELEMELDREQHLARARQAFEQCDVLVFTLGLTEAWTARACGSVLPVCPGVAGGEYNPERYEFRNFTVEECVADMRTFISEFRTVNPGAWIVLTVSPVPLIATAGSDDVVCATSYSKSVLRVVAEQLRREERVVYFPSYEIITSPATAGRYFTNDLRDISVAGISHAMRVFFETLTDRKTAPPAPEGDIPSGVAGPVADHRDLADEIAEAECDEEIYDRVVSGTGATTRAAEES